MVAAVATATGTASAQPAPGSVPDAQRTLSSANGKAPNNNCPFDYGSPHSLGQDNSQQPLDPHSYSAGGGYGQSNGCIGVGGAGAPDTPPPGASGTTSGTGATTSGGTTRSGTTAAGGTTGGGTPAQSAPATGNSRTGAGGTGAGGTGAGGSGAIAASGSSASGSSAGRRRTGR